MKIADQPENPSAQHAGLFDGFMLTAPLTTEIRHFEFNIGVQDRTLNCGLSEGAMITSGSWFLERTGDFKSWERLVEFSLGNVAAFAQDTVA